MSKWIRWKGLIPFVVIVAALAAFFILFIDTLAKNLIESTGSDMVGAKVEAGEVDVRIAPLGMTINGLKVANPKAPMSNAVEIARIGFGLDSGQLLLGKVIIDEMTVDGVRFDTPRQTSGALPEEKADTPAATKAPSAGSSDNKPAKAPQQTASSQQESEDAGLDMPSIDLPDVDTIIEREPLKTQKVADELKASVKQTEQHWDKLEKKLPDDDKVKAYQRRLKKIQKTDPGNIPKLLKAVDDLKSLQKDVQSDLADIDKARKQVKQDLAEVDSQYNALLKAPAQDKARLADKYAPSSEGIGNLSALLFGPKAADWTRQGLYWYEKLAPMLSGEEEQAPEPKRLEGIDVAFAEYTPRPDFHIKRIKASVSTAKGDFNGVVRDVTHQPEVLGRPATLNFSGRDMRGMKALKLTGRFDHTDPNHRIERLDLAIDDYKVSKTDLTQAPGLRLRMASALSDTRFKASRVNGRLDGDMNIHIRNIDYDNEAGPGEFQQLMVESFNKVKDFNIDAKIDGTLGQPGLHISSDLDRRLNAQIQKAFDRRVADYRKDLNRRIEEATAEPVAQARQQVEALRSEIEGKLAAAEARLEQQRLALQGQIDAFQAQVEAEKRKAQQQLDAEKRKAKEELERKAQELLNQLGQ